MLPRELRLRSRECFELKVLVALVIMRSRMTFRMARNFSDATTWVWLRYLPVSARSRGGSTLFIPSGRYKVWEPKHVSCRSDALRPEQCKSTDKALLLLQPPEVRKKAQCEDLAFLAASKTFEPQAAMYPL